MAKASAVEATSFPLYCLWSAVTGGEPRAKDVAAVPARSGGTASAARGVFWSVSQTLDLPTHPGEMYPNISRKPRAHPVPQGDILPCEEWLLQQPRKCRLKDSVLSLTTDDDSSAFIHLCMLFSPFALENGKAPVHVAELFTPCL